MDRGENTQEPYVKRVTLPSGKSIEVLYFADQASGATQTPGGQRDHAVGDQPLHVCVDCGSDLVYPTDWQEAGAEHWEVDLRCPNCEWHGSGVFGQDIVESFDDELDRGIDVLLADYRALVASNMEDEIDSFAKALEHGAILPVDF